MMTIQVKDLLRKLRSGTLDVGAATLLEQLTASGLISDLRGSYPVIFQQRDVGKKHEVGMAHSLRFKLAVRKLDDSLFRQVFLFPVLCKCLFVSAYEDAISEITVAASIHIEPKGEGSTKALILKTRQGHKLDKSSDGWVLKPLQRRAVTLDETLLSKRGWKFEALIPFVSSV